MSETTEQNTIGFRKALAEKICSADYFKNNQQYVHTPFALCHEMVGKLAEATTLTGKYICTLNLEFVEVLCYDYGVAKENIWFITDCKEKANVLNHARYKGVNVIVADYLSIILKGNMKFDVICGNPPYQTKSDKDDRKTQAIWPDFVKKSISLLTDKGFLCFVHPCGWRDVDGMFKEIQNLLKSKNIKYLEIHDREDGVNTFGVQTAYDWYVVQNVNNDNKTIIKSRNGKTYEIDLKEIEFIPNSMFEEIIKLFAKNGEEKCNLISDSAYHTQQESWMKDHKTKNFKYPCIYTTLADGTINLWYSNTNKNGHFGIPGVIFSNGTSYPIIDEKGKYAVTQFAYKIVDDPKNLASIQKAMMTEKFIEIMNECQLVGKHRYARKTISLFKKDFWKQFVDEDGNEL